MEHRFVALSRTFLLAWMVTEEAHGPILARTFSAKHDGRRASL
jgi:hypothetical protein